MAAFDSIINVEEWISDHYLTTDETKGQSFGKQVAARIKGAPECWERLRAHRQELQQRLALLEFDDQDIDGTYALLASTFGYGKTSRLSSQLSTGELEFEGWQGHGVILINACTLSDPEDLPTAKVRGEVLVGGKDLGWSASKLVGELFLAPSPPAFVVVAAGAWMVIAERESWPLGRYLMVDVSLAAERNDTKARSELQRVAVILARENVERAADGTTWWAETIAESREHAVQVSAELRDAVKRSIEIIGNDVLNRYRQQGISTGNISGADLSLQSLRYLYRILFILFAEASPELRILPTGTPEYDEGYGIARLRDMVLSPPTSIRAENGTHLYDSLNLLFTLVDRGHEASDGLTFRNLSADLFQAEATSLIDRAGLSNAALHRVLENLLLSPEKSGRDRGFISYSTLGVTELGQVYEGLMSYTGFVAEKRLMEVAPHGDASKGSWVIPEGFAQQLPADSFVLETVDASEGGTRKRKRTHEAGSFVFRQSSRDRERSASFYTPQVLTEFVVSQAIEELEITHAEQVLQLRICEPAMGSGAFAVETVRQLAEFYLKLRQEELGEQIPAAKRPQELQKVKAFIALHQVYGVDLNATAVELAEISLWLDTMTAELKAPWFGLHLRRGNSLVGASRATYSQGQVAAKHWLKEVPRREPLTRLAAAVEAETVDPHVAGRVHHFLLPAAGWGATADAKDVKSIAVESQQQLKTWRKSFHKPTKSQVKHLQGLSQRVETLWQFALIRMQIAEEQTRRTIAVWGRKPDDAAANVTRIQIEADLFGNANGAYQRLRLVMDAWCALWFWTLTEETALPNMTHWLEALTDVLGRSVKPKTQNQATLTPGLAWEELGVAESIDWQFAGAKSIEDCLSAHPWLAVCQQIAKEQGFFHWDLDFAAVFARGGFDLQVGNPPWVRPRTDVDALLSESDPWFMLAHKPTQAEKKQRRIEVSDNPSARKILIDGIGESVATSAFLGSVANYPHLQGQQPDLYRGFMERTWANMSETGVVSLIHPESHFTEKKAAPLRRGAYLRLRRHWQFINELRLFDVHDLVTYGVHTYGQLRSSPSFVSAASLYHPKTVEDSMIHNGSGPLPGLKDDEGNWDRRPHRDRIIRVDEAELKIWKSILEGSDTPLLETRMVYTVNTEAAGVLAKLAAAPRVKTLGLDFSAGWHETADKKEGYFDVGWKHPESWADAILQGPHLGISTPMIKEPNPTLKHNQDWSEVDLEAMAADFIPATAYQPNRVAKPSYDADYGSWDGVPVASTYRVAWRTMAATTGFRTLYPAVIVPGTVHLFTMTSGASLQSNYETLITGTVFSSLLVDFFFRSSGLSHILASTARELPVLNESKALDTAINRYLRLNCLTSAYAPLWEEITGTPWTMDTPLRIAAQRRQAQNEIDAIVALSLGITADELCMVYQTQFPVMRKYDQTDLFDANGRKVPKEIAKLEVKALTQGKLSVDKRTWTHPQSGATYVYEYPFQVLDPEADLRAAYAHFEAELNGVN